MLELYRLTADLAQHSAQGCASLDLGEAIAAVVASGGLVVATPVLAAPPSEVFDSFVAVLGDGVLSGCRCWWRWTAASARSRPTSRR